jgi:hypothetical protein
METGIICMWSGTLATIPTGWLLCDGTNSTPDLRDKFIRGTPNATDPGGTGGANTHNHTVDIWANDKTGTILTEGVTNRTHIRDSSNNSDWVSTAAGVNIGSKGKRETTTTSNNIPEYYALAFLMKS